MTDDQMEELFEKFYRQLKEDDKINADMISESMSVGKLFK